TDAGDLRAAVGRRALRLRPVRRGDTEEGVLRRAVLDELLGDPRRLVDRDREADADAARLPARATDVGDGGVDPAGPARGVDEGTAGVAGVDRRGGLDGRGHHGSRLLLLRGEGGALLLALARGGRHRPVEGADDAGG